MNNNCILHVLAQNSLPQESRATCGLLHHVNITNCPTSTKGRGWGTRKMNARKPSQDYITQSANIKQKQSYYFRQSIKKSALISKPPSWLFYYTVNPNSSPVVSYEEIVRRGDDGSKETGNESAVNPFWVTEVLEEVRA